MIIKFYFTVYVLLFCSVLVFESVSQQNLSFSGVASVSSEENGHGASLALDADEKTSWRSSQEDPSPWITVRLPGATEVVSVALTMGPMNVSEQVQLQYLLNGEWRKVEDVELASVQQLEVELSKPLLIDRLRLQSMDALRLDIAMFNLIGQSYVDESVGEVKKILVNQSGYNLNRPKGFTAPEISDGTSFRIYSADRPNLSLYEGQVFGGKGYFHDFNPESEDEFFIGIGELTSFPFRIGPNWLERVTYRPMVDFMLGARHLVGNVTEKRPLSFEWRDGDFFNWSLQTLVAMYLSNPEAYNRMEVKGSYVSNDSYPAEYRGLWGTLDPFAPGTPDVVQLIHWDADVKVSMKLDHEMQKAELAHFLYVWPYLSQWLPRQNFESVYAFAKSVWTKSDVSAHANSIYDTSPEHDLLSLKTQLGTTKGEMPPGFSVIPNLMMYEAARKMGEEDADKYFDAAYRQMEWIVEHLDWEDPMTTKGQRTSEHVTMRAFQFFYSQYPDRHPAGLQEKVSEWAKVAISRSDNMWDFRKYSDEEWTPPGWNETGNILGFPAAAFAAMMILDDPSLVDGLELLAWSHLENAFGRNPTGRHYSYKGPEEIEGVDLGWYSRHRGGIGLLDELPLVFDGSPKSFHYPNNPEVGNLGWTEGWVQFNTAFNVSMAYMAAYYTELTVQPLSKRQRLIRLRVPLNMNYDSKDCLDLLVGNQSSSFIPIPLCEEGRFSEYLVGTVAIQGGKIVTPKGNLRIGEDEIATINYGKGYFRNTRKLW
ncbi:MAG: discoidin domain-containing protein [Lunatimonas sp.]|uniref:discoidin domain-containing protein n=1 Tax=Lunatimonas sp. TaxID=2060141 RepID=UPI00263B7D61|nr:discoidin domain-containing protein [Lunatimonas sp.]MCC5939325.1 discoidin domain-containing protein [Lunatimonas sp.]